MPDETNAPKAPDVPAPPASAASVALVEALLFASGKPATPEKLAEAAEIPLAEVEAALAEIARRCEADGRGVTLDRVAGGVRFVARNEFDMPIRRLLGMDGRTKLSMASLETLAIVAYRQPITAPEIAELRGVNSASSIRTLLDRKLITTAGRKPVVGTPFLYKTTQEFLVHFGLGELSESCRSRRSWRLSTASRATAAPDPSQTELFPSEETREEPREEPREESDGG